MPMYKFLVCVPFCVRGVQFFDFDISELVEKSPKTSLEPFWWALASKFGFVAKIYIYWPSERSGDLDFDDFHVFGRFQMTWQDWGRFIFFFRSFLQISTQDHSNLNAPRWGTSKGKSYFIPCTFISQSMVRWSHMASPSLPKGMFWQKSKVIYQEGYFFAHCVWQRNV